MTPPPLNETRFEILSTSNEAELVRCNTILIVSDDDDDDDEGAGDGDDAFGAGGVDMSG